MTNVTRFPIVVVDEEVLGYVVEREGFKTFYPMSVVIKGVLVYASGGPIMLGDRHVVRPAVLSDGEKFRIHLEGYGLSE